MKTQIHAISPLCHIATGTETPTLLCAASGTLDNIRSVLVHLMVQDADCAVELMRVLQEMEKENPAEAGSSVLAANAANQRNPVSLRAITRRWISLVPS